MDEREKLLEQYDEAAFALMMDEYAEAEGADFLARFRAAAQAGELSDMPEDLDRACREAISREYSRRERKSRSRHFRETAAKAAVMAVALAALAGTLILSVDALRKPLLYSLIQNESGDSIYTFQDPKDVMPSPSEPGAMVNILPVLLPESFNQVVFDELINGLVACGYATAQGQMVLFNVTEAKGVYMVDTEGAECRTIDLQGFNATYAVEDNTRRMWWMDEEKERIYSFTASDVDEGLFLELCGAIAAYYKD